MEQLQVTVMRGNYKGQTCIKQLDNERKNVRSKLWDWCPHFCSMMKQNDLP
jgi:hypothetical protein